MSINLYDPSIFESNNARHKTPQEVAQSFVPPANIFATLSSKNNHIVVGPRGSGKTTLLKMLTLPALMSWIPFSKQSVLPRSTFIGVFIPADNGWSVQINDNRTSSISIGTAAFTTHVLLAFVQTLIDIKNTGSKGREFLQKFPEPIDPVSESSLVTILADSWMLKPSLKSFEGLKLSLRKRLLDLKSIKKEAAVLDNFERVVLKRAPYITINFKDAISLGIDAFELISQTTGLSWGLLFDEFELAPEEIQKEVLNCMRGEEDGRLVFKVALAPYNESFISHFTQYNSFPSHDYQIINLFHPDKRSGSEFAENLLRRLLSDEAIEFESIEDVLGTSEFSVDKEQSSYGPSGKITKVFQQLKEVDPSFRKYYEDKNLGKKIDNWESLAESERATIRKMRSVVVTRQMFLKDAPPGEVGTRKRSRKRPVLYAGYPTILEICEGNPRTIINLFIPLIKELKESGAGKVKASTQAEKITSAASSFRALLKTIAYKQAQHTISLLELLDNIGFYFRDQCIGQEFRPEPALSFRVPVNPDPSLVSALGKALNSGAIIYVPDAKADPILSSVDEKRFRLNYLLATHYDLPIMHNSYVSLNKILSSTSSENLTLFLED